MAIQVVEFSRGGYKIRKIFAQESTYSKEMIEFWELVLWRGVKKCHNLTFKVNSMCHKLLESFSIFFSLKNINLGAHFLLLTFFDNIKIEWLLFLKCHLFFDTSPLNQFSKFNNFLWVCWFLGKNLSNFVSLPWKLHNRYCHIV